MLRIRWAANAARPVAADDFPALQREIVCQKSLFVPLLGPGSMTLVRGLGLNKPHRSPRFTGTEAD